MISPIRSQRLRLRCPHTRHCDAGSYRKKHA
jgi:hypothetical protein